MKLLVFAHIPPPHHGQSYMVQLLLSGLRAAGERLPPGDPARIECYHVNAQFSDDIGQIGKPGFRKILLALRFSWQAIRARFRHGVTHFYYVPASSTRAALYRDWIVLALCRPFFRRIIYHWHSVGLGDWLATGARPWERWITRRLLWRPDLSLVLTEGNRRDGELLESGRIEVVPNGMPDPCPAYDTGVRPRREARRAARALLLAGEEPGAAARAAAGGDPEVFQILYLSLCYRPKGLFDAVEGVVLANRQLREQGSRMRVRLTIAGKFFAESERLELEERLRQPDLATGPESVRYVGFASGADKERLFRESDVFCFPSYYELEGHPVSLLEAMAFDLPCVVTRWRSLPALFPPGYPGLIEPRAPAQVASALLGLLSGPPPIAFRARFLDEFTVDRFVERISAALRTVE